MTQLEQDVLQSPRATSMLMPAVPGEVPALQALGLSVGYRRRRAVTTVLGDLHLTAAAGTLTGIVGPNGAGKSTLLRTITGLQAPLQGNVRIGGRDITDLSPLSRARELAVVTSERTDPGLLRGAEVVALGRYPHTGWGGRLDSADRAIVAEALAATEAEHLADRPVAMLSDGERQRIMVARALAQQPKVLVLDEPSAFLDLPGRVDLTLLMRRLAREVGIAVLVATHDLDLLLRSVDQLWLVHKHTVHSGTRTDEQLCAQMTEAFGSSFTIDSVTGNMHINMPTY